MLKSSQSSKKGQWFIISAVVISGVFLIISSMLRVSFGIDAAEVGRRNENFYFNNIKEQETNVEAKCLTGDANVNFAKDMREFSYFSEHIMGSRGYYFFMNYTVNGCHADALGLMVASEKGMFYQNVDPNYLIPNII